MANSKPPQKHVRQKLKKLKNSNSLKNYHEIGTQSYL